MSFYEVLTGHRSESREQALLVEEAPVAAVQTEGETVEQEDVNSEAMPAHDIVAQTTEAAVEIATGTKLKTKDERREMVRSMREAAKVNVSRPVKRVSTTPAAEEEVALSEQTATGELVNDEVVWATGIGQHYSRIYTRRAVRLYTSRSTTSSSILMQREAK